MDRFAGRLAFVAVHGFGGLQGLELVQTQPLKHTAYGGRRDPATLAMCRPVQAQAAQAVDQATLAAGVGPVQAVRPRAAVLQARSALGTDLAHPFAHRSRADA